MKESFHNAKGGVIIVDLIGCINSNATYLSELDGKIGDGDHGINMEKGFRLFGERIDGQVLGFRESLELLGEVLLSKIGGSMGPIYGGFFLEMADACQVEKIDKETLLAMYEAAMQSVESVGTAKVGDKTMMDTLIPAVSALQKSVSDGYGFHMCLKNMKKAAEDGMNSTRDIVAKLGRSARLGERSRGVLDAGAVSCYLIVCSIADSIVELLD